MCHQRSRSQSQMKLHHCQGRSTTKKEERDRLNEHCISKGAVSYSKDRFLTTKTPKEQKRLTHCQKKLQYISQPSSAMGPN
eukprot:2218201-Ditylum_brightwellii.AAC.1